MSDAVRCHCIVVRSGADAIALLGQQNSPCLPSVSLPRDAWPPDEAAAINAQLIQRHGLNCTMLSWLGTENDEHLLVMEWHPGGPEPKDCSWLNIESAQSVLAADQARCLEKWQGLDQQLQMPWERPGWMDQVISWLMRLFDGRQFPRLTNLAQIKAAWGMSSVLLIETTGGRFYFKAGACQGVEESKLVSILHERFPRNVHAPIAVNIENGWMVTREIENEPFAAGDFDGLSRAFQAYADIQLGCGDIHRSGVTPGIRMRGAFWLRVHLDAMFSPDRCPEEFTDQIVGLDATARDRLKDDWYPRLDLLNTSRLPLTLNQEDLHFDNILNTPDGPVFIDWADCAIAHPLFGLDRILALWGQHPSELEQQEKERVQEAYLDSFGHLADRDQLISEWELCRSLRMLYLAFHWQELARQNRNGSQWGQLCAANAVKFLQRAIDQVLDR